MLLHNKAQKMFLLNINSIQVLLLLQQQEAGIAIFIGKTYGQLVYLRDVGGIVVLYCSSYKLSDYNTQICAVHAAVYTMAMEATARPAIVIIIHMQCVHCDYNRTL